MKDLKIYLIAGAILLTAYVVMQYNQPKETDWNVSYINTKKSPFGTFVIYNHIKDLFPDARVTPRRQSVHNVLVDTEYKNAAYIIICNRIQTSEEDQQQLERFIKAGNDAFIAAEDFGTLFRDRLNIKANDLYGEYNKPEYISFVNPALNPDRQYFVDKGAINNYFSELDTANTVVLGVNNNGLANFIKYKIGKGSLYLSANPKMFANYGLLKPLSAQYAPAALSYLNPKQILWDEYYSQGSANEASPMRVFFNNPALRHAYYTALFSLIVYVLYNLKRRQRPIPVIEPLQNSTLDFVRVVGQVYYESHDNQNIAHKKILYFLTFLREQFSLQTNKLDDDFTNALAQKAGIEQADARELVDYMNYIAHQQRVSDYELMQLNKLIENFYTISA
ncbi:DUF4350 domain-containing protein [Mucilaginibacter hurinus]|uniref:DUF4350 domain-containing protein n=1 Tax=Mucilaginibacter hurinus TaxID=2201324 RepID=A0A367GJS3_9SPHI|nr:DUF4350 domain-containing protein [Mucilaginibacter hurinus]RCH53727.1 DUF4350 domain-containing protein [Mucilaginibacter hurinus]